MSKLYTSRCDKGNTFSISIGATGECIGIDVPVHDPSIPIHQIFFLSMYVTTLPVHFMYHTACNTYIHIHCNVHMIQHHGIQTILNLSSTMLYPLDCTV